MEKNGLFSQRIRLRHLHTFVAVAQQGTLGRAAETLNLSQPALSKTLNELEQLTGTRLFERGRLGAQLTLVGEQFLTHAVKVLDALNSAGQALNRKEGLNNDIVRIGALPTAALGILPTVIGQFHKQQKDITLQVATMNNTMLLAGLKSGKIDIGIGRMSDPELMSGLHYELLFLESLKLVVRPGHPLLQETVTLSRVMEWPVVVSPKGTVPRQNAEALLQSQGCKMPAGCIETLSASLSRQLTVDFDYVWFVPSGAVKDDLRRGVLTALPIATQGAGEPIGILTRVDATLTPGTQTLLSAIRKSMPA
ncbi:LysR substrate-binding domain-containing protein [Klebsiella quasipneumoniae subsp. similipneumoniae]|uniref:LysR substrate-binding domain-containing protein n=1 Tax=Klebsiella quasipneumoniae subsp. similipneumoniae TaxID=1463164 RepID=A0AAE4MMX4_9ENTR|nr:LysR substrate-binding domain-containing protein [Klebsiella quasipneumoniae]MDV0609889.1 LysR substrate-binding domain-containing protein [Klebsiella quasipneumoniae subsp. similipneumoniae]MDV0637029.1 LysR substrate-binding domain-containing protein [Klebsiella quasipneumoniae subsp. similipneumoniae]MDV0725231.1 LysR substrate-binding domain-containing protein [Klebsiella quasipneumoniae subsp. similipneumoniae]MDV0736091.1 LysR substrate-binding domain-containing protein [Klebsiella qua